jgi:hypothetical protein
MQPDRKKKQQCCKHDVFFGVNRKEARAMPRFACCEPCTSVYFLVLFVYCYGTGTSMTPVTPCRSSTSSELVTATIDTGEKNGTPV